MEIFNKILISGITAPRPPLPANSDLIGLGVLSGHQESLKATLGDFNLQQSWRVTDLIVKNLNLVSDCLGSNYQLSDLGQISHLTVQDLCCLVSKMGIIILPYRVVVKLDVVNVMTWHNAWRIVSA